MAKIQFNSKSFAPFRAIMGKYHNAQHSTKDTLGRLRKGLKDDEASLARNEETLEKLNAGDKSVHASKEDLEKTIEQFKTQIENRKKDMKNCVVKQQKAEIDAVALVTDELYNAYKEYIIKKGDGDADAYAQAIADWFMGVQECEDKSKVQVHPSGCMGYIGLVSSMNDGSSQKTGMLRKPKTKKAFTQEWLKTLADNLQNAKVIDAYKYEYIPVRMRGKNK